MPDPIRFIRAEGNVPSRTYYLNPAHIVSVSIWERGGITHAEVFTTTGKVVFHGAPARAIEEALRGGQDAQT